jgi:hypothetical protein
MPKNFGVRVIYRKIRYIKVCFLSLILIKRKYIVSIVVIFLISETFPYMSLSYLITAVYCVFSIKYVSIVKPSCAIMRSSWLECSPSKTPKCTKFNTEITDLDSLSWRWSRRLQWIKANWKGVPLYLYKLNNTSMLLF